MSFFSQWVSKLKMFGYEKGFYIFPIFANSPETMLEGLKKTPGVKYHRDQNYFSCSNFFLTGEYHFEELEAGLWLIVTRIHFKKNVSFKGVFDPDLPPDYFRLSLHINTSSQNVMKSVSGDYFQNDSSFWKVYGPRGIASSFNYKSTETLILNICFNKDWLERNLKRGKVLSEKAQNAFDGMDHDYLLVPNRLKLLEGNHFEIIKAIQNKDANGLSDPLKVKTHTLELVSAFASELNQENEGLGVESKDQGRLLKVSQILRESIFSTFPKIEKLSKRVGVSETKLKAGFKQMFGKTLYQFYCECQMDHAEIILKKGDESIKSVAFTLGYSNPSKFSAAFKRVKGKLPSEVLSEVKVA